MTGDQWYTILFPPFAIIASLWMLYMVTGKKPVVPKPKAKKKKSRRQRKMEREIFRRAIDAGASEHEARKAVRLYVARRHQIL